MRQDQPPAPLGDAAPFRFAVVVSRFNDAITRSLRDAATTALQEAGAANVQVFEVPGAFEIPQASRAVAESGRFDAVICLGCIVRGDTPHFDYVAGEAARGIQQVSLCENLPVIFGVLTTNTEQQALDRAGGVHSHAGVNAAEAAAEMIITLDRIRRG